MNGEAKRFCLRLKGQNSYKLFKREQMFDNFPAPAVNTTVTIGLDLFS